MLARKIQHPIDKLIKKRIADMQMTNTKGFSHHIFSDFANQQVLITRLQKMGYEPDNDIKPMRWKLHRYAKTPTARTDGV